MILLGHPPGLVREILRRKGVGLVQRNGESQPVSVEWTKVQFPPRPSNSPKLKANREIWLASHNSFPWNDLEFSPAPSPATY